MVNKPEMMSAHMELSLCKDRDDKQESFNKHLILMSNKF